MNVSPANVTLVAEYRDSFTKAVIKNVIVVLLSLFINYINAGLLYTFCEHQIFNSNPRYILFIHLVVNDMIQVSLAVILFIVSYIVYKLPVVICCMVTLLSIIATENSPLNLACMAIECYIAVCFPLRHPQICTIKRTRILIGFIWLTTTLFALPDLFQTLAIEPLDFFKSNIFCVREVVFQNPSIIERRNITYITYLCLVWCVLFYTYFKILLTAKTAGKDAKKARNTIFLHGFQLLLCMATYVEHLLKLALQQWFPKNYSDSLFACYVFFQLLPRSISPILYGIRDQTYRKHLKKYLVCKMIKNQVMKSF